MDTPKAHATVVEVRSGRRIMDSRVSPQRRTVCGAEISLKDLLVRDFKKTWPVRSEWNLCEECGKILGLLPGATSFERSYGQALSAAPSQSAPVEVPPPKPLVISKPTPEQLTVLEKLAASGEPLVYFKGGYWSTPRPTGAPAPGFWRDEWYTSKQTMTAMENRGWLMRLPQSTNYDVRKFPGLEDRALTDGGRQVLEKYRR